MLPIAPLMLEHKLILRAVALMEKEQDKIGNGGQTNPSLIDSIVDFLRNYADRCHHGKEEDILFSELAKKPMYIEHKKIMQELLDEHVIARKTVGELFLAKEKYVSGVRIAAKDIAIRLKELTKLYPAHIEKENKNFFVPCMQYFSKQEQDNMLKEFWDFDRSLVHEKYTKIVEGLERA